MKSNTYSMNQSLNIFVEVVRTKSFTKASKRLFMTPQGVSKSIKKLEEEYQCILFYRKTEGLELTESGACFLDYVKRILKTHKEMIYELEYIRQREEGVVDMLSGFGIVRLLTPDCIQTFKKKYPEIEFHCREFPDRRVEEYFQNRQGNVAFSVGNFDESLYEVTKLWSIPLRLLVNRLNPLNQKKSATILDLKKYPLYIESKDFAAYHIIMDKCHKAGFEPQVIFETSGFSLCHKMVAENKGISVTMDFMLDDMNALQLNSIPFTDGDYNWNVCMLRRRGEDVGSGVNVFCGFVQQWVENMQNGAITR